MQPPPPRWLLLLLALRLCSGASVPGESCGARFSASNCRATQDYISTTLGRWRTATRPSPPSCAASSTASRWTRAMTSPREWGQELDVGNIHRRRHDYRARQGAARGCVQALKTTSRRARGSKQSSEMESTGDFGSRKVFGNCVSRIHGCTDRGSSLTSLGQV